MEHFSCFQATYKATESAIKPYTNGAVDMAFGVLNNISLIFTTLH